MSSLYLLVNRKKEHGYQEFWLKFQCSLKSNSVATKVIPLTQNIVNSCCHQCTACGVLYECERETCEMRFQYDRCTMCRLKSNYWLYYTTKVKSALVAKFESVGMPCT